MSDERGANAIDRRIGLRLKTRRLELGVSQERLADLLGVTFQQVQKYEKGINRVSASRLFDVSAALDVPIGYFFEGLDLPLTGSGVSEEGREALVYDMLATPEGLELLTLFGSIKSARVRRRVVELVRALTDDVDSED